MTIDRAHGSLLLIKSEKLVITKYFYKLTFLFCLYPFTLRFFDRDLQPIYFVMLILSFLFTAKSKLSKNTAILGGLGIAIILYRFRFQYEYVDVVRSFPTYLTPFLLFRLLETKLVSQKFMLNSIKYAIYIYTAYAVVQYLGFDVLQFDNPLRVAAGRGMTSLSPEPSMFGFILNLMMMCLIISGRDSRSVWFFFLLGLILCGSASALLCSIPLLVAKVDIGKIVIAGISFTLISFGLFEFLLSDYLPERTLYLLSNQGLEVLLSDLSINERLGHLYFIFTNFSHYFIGGINGWGQEYTRFIESGNTAFFFGSSVNNILSGLGSVLYDGGLLGVIFLMILFKMQRLSSLKNVYRNPMVFLSLGMVAIQSVSLAFPVLIIAIWCIQSVSQSQGKRATM